METENTVTSTGEHLWKDLSQVQFVFPERSCEAGTGRDRQKLAKHLEDCVLCAVGGLQPRASVPRRDM